MKIKKSEKPNKFTIEKLKTMETTVTPKNHYKKKLKIAKTKK